jgi:hypothetical protein
MRAPKKSERLSARISESLFACMTRLYPRSFRGRFADSMRQVFRDQLAEAMESGGGAVLRLWIHTLFDMARSIVWEHLTERSGDRRSFMKERILQVRQLSFVKLFGIVFLAIVVAVAAATSLSPRLYRGLARVEISRGGENAAGYDPYLMQTEFEKIRSRKVLEPVVQENLELPRRFAAMNGGEVPRLDQRWVFLRNMITLRQSRNTSLIEIGVYDSEPGRAARVANAIAESYRRNSEQWNSGTRVFIIDRATPTQNAIRPNIPLNMTLGLALGLPVAAIGAFLARLFFKSFPKRVSIG